MRKNSRLLKMLPAVACALALAACGKSQNQQSYVIPEEGPKVDLKKLDAKATSLRLADAAFDKGEYAMAAQLYYRAAELQPDNTAIVVKLGFALFKSGAAADAEKVFRSALEKEPKSADALRGLAHSLVGQGRAGEALSFYKQAIAASGKPDARIYAGLGAALDMTGKHEEARAAYQAGHKVAPQDHGLRNNLALSYAMSGDTAKAREILATLGGAETPKAKPNLSAVRNKLAAQPASPTRQTAEAAPARPAPKAARAEPPAHEETPAHEKPAADTRDVAEVPAPAHAAPVSRK